MVKLVDEQIDRIDRFQKNHKAFAFGYAVIKKYGDDRSGHNAALITYYGFLSLFPLLVVLTSLLQIFVGNGGHSSLVNSINNYFPVLGKDLSSNVHSLHRNSTFGLIFGFLGTIYGARGVADILRFTINQTWHVPMDERLGFPHNLLNSLSIIGVGGLGVILSIVSSGYATSLGRGFGVRILTTLLSFIILFLTLYVVFRLAISTKVRHKTLMLSAFITAVSVQILETVGNYIISHEMRNFSSVYGTFAIVLGLFFWIYLLAQVMLYALQIGVVKQKRLWPRAINSENPTEADARQAVAQKV